MMDIAIPIPALGVFTLLGFFTPYAVALVNQPFWPTGARKAVAIGVSLGLAGVALAGYYVLTGEGLPSWPVLVLLALVVSQASYALVTKDLGARQLEDATSPEHRA